MRKYAGLLRYGFSCLGKGLGRRLVDVAIWLMACP